MTPVDWDKAPAVSAIISTRSRPELAERAVESMLGNGHDSFELALVGKSDTEETGVRINARGAGDPR